MSASLLGHAATNHCLLALDPNRLNARVLSVSRTTFVSVNLSLSLVSAAPLNIEIV